MNVVVTGASGFIGNHIIRTLVNDGHSVVGLSRKAPSPERRVDLATYIAGVDIQKPDTLPPDAFANANAVIHLVGVILERRPKQTFQGVHVDGTRNVVSAAKKGEVAKFIYMSAIGSSTDASSEYSRTKAAAEKIVKESGLDYVILRPSIVLGKDGEFVEQMGDLVKYGGLPVKIPFPVIPVPGSGNNKFQPIYVEDLAECVSKSVSDSSVSNTIIEVAGSDQVTFNDLIATFAKAEKVKKPMLHAPIPLLSLVAPLVELLPNPPFSGDQLKNLGKDNIADIGPMRAAFNIEPIGFNQIMQDIFDTDNIAHLPV